MKRGKSGILPNSLRFLHFLMKSLKKTLSGWQHMLIRNLYVAFSINGCRTDVAVTHDAMVANTPVHHHRFWLLNFTLVTIWKLTRYKIYIVSELVSFEFNVFFGLLCYIGAPCDHGCDLKGLERHFSFQLFFNFCALPTAALFRKSKAAALYRETRHRNKRREWSKLKMRIIACQNQLKVKGTVAMM